MMSLSDLLSDSQFEGESSLTISLGPREGPIGRTKWETAQDWVKESHSVPSPRIRKWQVLDSIIFDMIPHAYIPLIGALIRIRGK